MSGDGATDVADTDDRGCHCDSSSESSPKAWYTLTQSTDSQCSATSPSSIRKKSSVVKSAATPLPATVPSQTLLDATRLFSATICVWVARPSGSAPRVTAIALTNAARPSGVQPEFWT